MSRQLSFMTVAALGLAGCSPQPPAAVVTAEQMTASPDPAARRPLFGDLHLHTTYSYDAWGMVGARTTPEEAYRFAMGEPVRYLGESVRRDEPLDFLAVTDHSEYLGVLNQLDEVDSPFLRTDTGREFLANPTAAFIEITRAIAANAELPGVDRRAVLQSTWQRAINTANRFNRPGKFTTFIGYEWTSMPEGTFNLHRNVIFNGSRAPLPFTALDSKEPEDLWRHLDAIRREGLEAIAIPHNANASGGRMFDWLKSDGMPVDEAYARQRSSNEPLTEIVQIKGQSETVPELSANDEFANFEVMDRLMTTLEKSEPQGSYVRDALGRGLAIQESAGANPFKFGFVGGTDIHNGLSTSAENAFAGSNEGLSPDRLPDRDTARARIGPYITADIRSDSKRHFGGAAPFLLSSGGLTGVWAEANTRESIFAALKRRETFATSGSRMRIRMFGGWTFSHDLVRSTDRVSTAYRAGVPMGGDLPGRPHEADAPRFLVMAAKDPNGANLDRIQIVKVTGRGRAIRERIFDVALSSGREAGKGGVVPPVGNTVDLQSGTFTNTIGAAELSALWSDPEFVPGEAAAYYARAIEIPTPRWSTLLAIRHGLSLPSDKPLTIQERAWSSPIWYTPVGG